MNDVVSVVVPTFNRPDRLYRAIRSVLNQSYQHYEIIVVNDSESKDPVVQVVNKLNDSRVFYMENNRIKGANGARNTGVLAAKGKYVAFLDDDDEWLPGKLGNQLEYLNSHPNKCGVFNAFTIKNKSIWRKQFYNISNLTIKDVLLSQVTIGSSSNLLFRADVFKKTGLWDEDLTRQQDLELLVRILSSEQIGYQRIVAVKVYGHSDLHPRKALFGYREFHKKIRKYLNQMSSGQKNKFYSIYFRRLSMCYIKLSEFSNAIAQYRKALKFQTIDPKRDLRNLLLFIRQVCGSGIRQL